MILRTRAPARVTALLQTSATTLRSPARHGAATRFMTSTPSRGLHGVPSLGRYDNQYKAEGIDGLYTPEAFDFAWTKYQGHMVDRLNHVLAGDPRENWQTKDVLTNTAREPSSAHIFNYASMAHNNHFYFKTLSPVTTDMPEDLSKHLTASFSSVDTLRATFLATAAGMFGPGFVWLVQHQPANKSQNYTAYSGDLPFRILSTYIAGSPYPGAHARMQSTDLNTSNLGAAQSAAEFRQHNVPQNSVGAFGKHAARSGSMGDIGYGQGQSRDERRDERYGGANVVPVLCVNTWEHAWMMDWGVAGKREFLEAWWSRIDWDAVWANCVVPNEGPRSGRRL